MRINIGERQYINARISAGDRENQIKALAFSFEAYTVEIRLRNGNFYAYFTVEEEYPTIEITEVGVGLAPTLLRATARVAPTFCRDRGVWKSSILWEIPMPELYSGNSNKRD